MMKNIFARFRLSKVDKVLSSGMRKQLVALFLVTVAVWSLLYLVVIGFNYSSLDIYQVEPEEIAVIDSNNTTPQHPLWWAVYFQFVDAGAQNMTSDSARWLVMIISFLGTVVLSGIFISTVSNILERRIDKYNNGLIRYRYKKHIVIFGYNKMVSHLVKQLHATPKYSELPIIIQTSGSVTMARQELNSQLTAAESANVEFVYGRRDIEIELRSLQLEKAVEVFVMGEGYVEDKVEYAHDSLNMDCLNIIGKICSEKGRGERLPCNVLFEYQTTFSAFQFSNISKELEETVIFKPFNIHEDWAQKVFVSGTTANKKVSYLPLDREPIDAESDKYVHLVVVGVSKMGVALAMEAMRIAHFPNFKTKGRRTKITLIDLAADEEMMYLKSRNRSLFDMIHYSYEDIDVMGSLTEYIPTAYKHLGEPFIDIELEFIKGNIANNLLIERVDKWVRSKESVITIAICFNLPHTSLSSALAMPDSVYKEKIPVLVLQRDSSAVIHNIAGLSLSDEEREKLKYSALRPFGMDSDSIDIAANNNTQAMRVNFVYEYYYNNKVQPEVLPSDEVLMQMWCSITTVSHMWANIYNADSIATKLRSIGYSGGELTYEQIDILAEVEHNRWNVDRLLMGFRPPNKKEDREIEESNGAEKGAYKKRFIHYDIRPYDDLREDATGSNATEYDVCITKALPLIIQ